MTGDNIVGVGSVLIDPPEGNMREYLNSLERMLALPMLLVLLGGHGRPSRRRIGRSRVHHAPRRTRTKHPCGRAEGASTPKEIVERVYTDVSPKAHAMAERAVLAHLEKLREDGRHETGVHMIHL
jgi:glyoxylase-like metal-dependent hydrolase (beta-lactamase superfamily II)